MSTGAEQHLVQSLQDQVEKQADYIKQLENMVMLQMALRKVEHKNNERRAIAGANTLESTNG